MELGELVLMGDDECDIWGILERGATRSLIGVTIAEYLAYDLLEGFGREFARRDTARTLTSGDGARKNAMGTMAGDIFLEGGKGSVELSIMDNEVPLLIGIDILGVHRTSVVIDCGNGYVMLPKISPNLFQLSEALQRSPGGQRDDALAAAVCRPGGALLQRDRERADPEGQVRRRRPPGRRPAVAAPRAAPRH
ncbi:unnamed protein product, partial [Prorocentrum cordatum]